MSSVSQHLLKDPTDPGAPDVAEVHDATALSVEVLEDLVRSNDIDIVGLTGHINDVRGAAGQASLSDVLRRSEERRVGKEWRARRTSGQEKKRMSVDEQNRRGVE